MKYCQNLSPQREILEKILRNLLFGFLGHKPDCSQNDAGSSNAMEMTAAAIIWKRSICNYGMRYISIFSDGDAKT